MQTETTGAGPCRCGRAAGPPRYLSAIVKPTQATRRRPSALRMCRAAAAGEKGPVIGEAVPDDLVAEQLQEPEVLERGGEEPDDRVTLQEPRRPGRAGSKRRGRAGAAGSGASLDVWRPDCRLAPARCRRSVLPGPSSGHCRCDHVNYPALSRLSSFWSYCLAMVAMLSWPSATWANRSCMTLSASTVAQPGTGGVNWLTDAALK